MKRQENVFVQQVEEGRATIDDIQKALRNSPQSDRDHHDDVLDAELQEALAILQQQQ